jgi:PAS domain S-box-containing protein
MASIQDAGRSFAEGEVPRAVAVRPGHSKAKLHSDPHDVRLAMKFADQAGAIGKSAAWLHTGPRRYGFAVLVAVATTLAHYGLDRVLGPFPHFVMFFPGILVVALLAGFGPGLLTTILSTASVALMFWNSLSILGNSESREIVGLVGFSLIGAGLSFLATLYRRHEVRLREFERVVENLDEMIVVLDRNYRYLIANRAFLNYQGMRAEEVIGHRVDEVLGPEVFKASVEEKLEEAFCGKVVQYQMSYQYPVKGLRELLVSYYPIARRRGVDRVACVLQDVSDSKTADRSLRLFRGLVDQSNDAVEVLDPETLCLLDVNEKACQLLGYTRAELLSMTVYDIDRDADERSAAAIVDRLRNGESVLKETVHWRKDGSTFPVEASMKLVTLDRDYIIAVSRDISDRKKARDALHESERYYRSLFDNMLNALAYLKVHFEQGRAVDFTYLDVNKAFEAKTGFKNIVGKKTSELFPGLRESDPELFERYGRVALTGVPERFDTYVAAIGSWHSVSVYSPRKGFVVVVFDVITERKRAEAALRESEDRYRDLVEHSEDLVCTHDLEGNLLSVNPAPARCLGYSVEELLRIPMQELVAAEFRAEFDDYLKRIQIKGVDKGMLCVTTRSGERRIWEYNNSLRTEGVTRPIVRGLARDVTEQKKAEAALRSSEQQYRLLFEKNLAGVAIATLDGTMLDCNDAWAQMLGYTREEIRGREARDFYVNPDERESLREELAQTGALSTREVRLRRKDGTAVCVLFNSVLRTADKGTPILQGTAIDITNRRRVEEELRHREEDYRRFVERSSEGIFREELDAPLPLDLPEDELIHRIIHDSYLAECNDAMARMYGFESSKGLIGKRLSELLVPDDPRNVEMTREYIRSSFRLLERESHEVDAQGNKKIFRNSIIGIVEDGKLLRTWGIQRDVTEQVKLEEEIRRNEARFRLALKDSPITVFSQDKDLRYIWIYNSQMLKSEEIIGKTDEELMGAQKIKRLVELKRHVLGTGTALREEVVILNSGKKNCYDLSLEPVFDANKNVVGIRGVAVDIVRLREMTDRLEEATNRLTQERSYLEDEIRSELGFEEIIGHSASLREVLKKARVVAPIDSTVLLLGETGTGKELVARSVHALSPRCGKTFVKLNCAAVPSGLLESELFGHEKGAFTGAVNQKVGRIELADKGTLFLDEIGELPPELQPKLLRVLQDREFERLGGVRTLHVDVRIIAATNRDVQKEVSEKRFREDLFYRLNVFPIELPPLRHRREDIPMLVEHFVAKHAKRLGKPLDTVPDETMAILKAWNWPGNIRELENMIERMVILSKGRVLAAPPAELREAPDSAENDLTEMEREHIIRVLRETNGVLSGLDGAANRLGVKRTTLQSMLKRFGIDAAEYRRSTGTFANN